MQKNFDWTLFAVLEIATNCVFQPVVYRQTVGLKVHARCVVESEN